jgi:hypothetical protein
LPLESVTVILAERLLDELITPKEISLLVILDPEILVVIVTAFTVIATVLRLADLRAAIEPIVKVTVDLLCIILVLSPVIATVAELVSR